MATSSHTGRPAGLPRAESRGTAGRYLPGGREEDSDDRRTTPTPALPGRLEPRRLHRHRGRGIRLDPDGSRDRLRRPVRAVRHAGDGPQDVRGDAGVRGRDRRRGRVRQEDGGLLADTRPGRPPTRGSRRRRPGRRRREAEDGARQGHLAVRRRQPLPATPRRRRRGLGRDRRPSGAARLRHPADSGRGTHAAHTPDASRLCRDWHGVAGVRRDAADTTGRSGSGKAAGSESRPYRRSRQRAR